jgi:hypothetical protein
MLARMAGARTTRWWIDRCPIQLGTLTGLVRRWRQLTAPQPTLLFLISGDGIFRGWRTALRFFRARFYLRDWSARHNTFSGRFAFGSTYTTRSRLPLRSRTAFTTCPAFPSCFSLRGRSPFCSGGALRCGPLFPSRPRDCCTFLPLCHLAPPIRACTLTKKMH